MMTYLLQTHTQLRLEALLCKLLAIMTCWHQCTMLLC